MRHALLCMTFLLSTTTLASATDAEDRCSAAFRAGDHIGAGVYCEQAAEDEFLQAGKLKGRDKYVMTLLAGETIGEAGMSRLEVSLDPNSNFYKEGHENMLHSVATLTDLGDQDSVALQQDIDIRLRALAISKRWAAK